MNRAHKEFLASADWAKWLDVQLVPWLDGALQLGDDVLEVGPGPGLTTDLLRRRAASVTAVELDPELADALRSRLAGTNVAVIEGDATRIDLDGGRFSAAACFSMLHHIPEPGMQDAVFAEAQRLLRPGGVFFGVDSVDSDMLREFHSDDVFVPLDPATLPDRLMTAGFQDVDVEAGDFELRFTARKR